MINHSWKIPELLLKTIFFKSSTFSKKNLQKICKVYFYLQTPPHIWILWSLIHLCCLCFTSYKMSLLWASAYYWLKALLKIQLFLSNYLKKILIFFLSLSSFSELNTYIWFGSIVFFMKPCLLYFSQFCSFFLQLAIKNLVFNHQFVKILKNSWRNLYKTESTLFILFPT